MHDGKLEVGDSVRVTAGPHEGDTGEGQRVFRRHRAPGVEDERMTRKENASPDGLTPEEREILSKTVDMWNLFVELPIEHPADRVEFMHAVHACQQMIMSRPVRRLMNAQE